MTTSQLKHRQEQMEAARLEFRQIWKLIWAKCYQGCSPADKARIEHCCWLTFLAAKGLTQQTAKGLAGEKA